MNNIQQRTAILFVSSSCHIRKIWTFKRLCTIDPTIHTFVFYGALADRDSYTTTVQNQIDVWVSLKRYNKQLSPLLSLESSPHLCIFSADNLNDRVFVDTHDGNVIPDIDIELDTMLDQNRFNTTLFHSTKELVY